MHKYFITFYYQQARTQGFGTAEGYGNCTISADKRIEDSLKEDPNYNVELGKQVAKAAGYKKVAILWFKEL